MTTQYLALLRGINVGGNNMIKMADLKLCLESAGYQNVVTYIQSGNVLFEAPKTDDPTLERELERILSETFNHYKAWVTVRSLDDMQRIVDQAPAGFGRPDYRCDVLFVRSPLTPVDAMKDVMSIGLKEGVDTAATGKSVLYFARLADRATSSRLSRIISLPMYQDMTIRNWNTTTKLLAMMQAR